MVALIVRGDSPESSDVYLLDQESSEISPFYVDSSPGCMDRSPIWTYDGQTLIWSHATPSENNIPRFDIVCKSLASSKQISEYDDVITFDTIKILIYVS